MKIIIYIIFIILLSIQFISTRIKNNIRAYKSHTISNLKALAKMRSTPDSFDPNKITKYYKDQEPPKNNTLPFIDPLFPPNFNSLEGKDSKGNIIDTKVSLDKAEKLLGKNIKNGKSPEWKKAQDIFNGKPFYVFKDSIEPADVQQQEIGDCYFISAVAAITEFPHLIYQLFRTTTVSKNGYYELVLFIDGEWQVIILDDYFVVKGGSHNPKFAKPNGEEIWVILLEKAWAKINQGYVNIIGGADADSYYSLTGFISDSYKHTDFTIDNLWKIISISDENNEILSASTPIGDVVEQQLNNGIVKGHAYTLVGIKKINAKNNEIRLVQLRNPWGEHEWNGKWSDNSPLWTEELKKEANFKESLDDGIFFMSFEDFIQNFENTVICRIKYGSLIKSNYIKDDDMSNPIVFNLNLQENSLIVLETFVRHWRFNRGLNNDPNKITSMLLGSYDNSGNISFINSNCNSDEYVNLSLNLNKGNYVLWVYNSYFMLNDKKPDHYIVRIISQSKNIKFQNVGIDSESKLISKLMNAAIGDNSDVNPLSNGLFIKHANKFPNTCIGYTRYSLPSKSKSSIVIDFDTTTSVNMSLLAPYNKSPPKIISFNLVAGSSYIVLGVRIEYYSSYMFNISSSYGHIFKSKESKVEFIEDINIADFILPSSKLKQISYDYISTEMSEALKVKHFKY